MTTSILTTLTKADGITAACCGDPAALSFSYASDVSDSDRVQFKQVFEAMIHLLNLMPDEDELKITVNAQSLVLRRNKGVYVGVVAVKSHPVVKSLARMMRQAFRKQGAPLPEKRRRTNRPPTPQAPSVAPARPLDGPPPAPPPKGDDDSGPPPAF